MVHAGVMVGGGLWLAALVVWPADVLRTPVFATVAWDHWKRCWQPQPPSLHPGRDALGRHRRRSIAFLDEARFGGRVVHTDSWKRHWADPRFPQPGRTTLDCVGVWIGHDREERWNRWADWFWPAAEEPEERARR